MVFRIFDLFLFEGYTVVFTIALALLKQAQCELLTLDYEGVLKYLQNIPCMYTNVTHFTALLKVWEPLHANLSHKQLNKLESSYAKLNEAKRRK